MESHINQVSEAIAPVLRLRDVEALTGRKRSSIYEDMAAGRMPKPIKLGPHAVGWLRSDIEQWPPCANMTCCTYPR